jgi:Alpha-glutamyl/putrescinyl thymine pyrophosphorylase clade 2
MKMTMTNIYKFGDDLIQSRDLDPVYCALYGAQLSEPQLARLLLGYLAFYHLGASAWLSEHEGDAFWMAMLAAARNDTPSPLGRRWPRGSERRHFRGAKCVTAVTWLQAVYQTPEAPIRSLLDCKTAKHVISRIEQWPMFGPWSAYKAADLLDRCVGHPLQFDPNIGLLYREPRAGLDLLAAELNQSPLQIYAALRSYFSARKAPPRDDRSCGAAEVETILCKYKAMRGGHYFVGKDIIEVRHALQGWGTTAAQLLQSLDLRAYRHWWDETLNVVGGCVARSSRCRDSLKRGTRRDGGAK